MFEKGTFILMADGHLEDISAIKSNSYVMCEDGTPGRVAYTTKAKQTIYEIVQKTKHRANEGEPGRLDPRRRTVYNRLGFNCSATHKLVLKTPSIPTLENNPRRPNLTVKWRCLEEILTTDGRAITVPKNHHKNFPKTKEGQLQAQNFMRDKRLIWGPDIDYEIQVRDLEYLDASMRVTSTLKCNPVFSGNGILSNFLSGQRHLITPAIVCMAWLLGLWIGDGTTKEPEITVDSVDEKLMESLTVLGRYWGLYPTYKDEKVPLRAKHVRLYYGKGPEERRKTRNLRKNNPFWNTIQNLGFKREIDGEKQVPEFMWHEDIEIREAFLAGLIDSDGYVVKRKENPDVYKVSIQTIYPSVMNAIVHIARSLGISATVTTRSARNEVIEGRRVQCRFTYDCNISGSTPLQNVLSYCRSGHKRKPAPEVVIRDPQYVGFIDRKLREAEVYGIHLDQPRNILLGNKIVVYSCTECCETDAVHITKIKNLKHCVSCPRTGVRYFYRDWTGKSHVCGRCYGRYKFSGYRCLHCKYIPEAREIKKARMRGEETRLFEQSYITGLVCSRCEGILTFDETRGPARKQAVQ